VFRLDEVKALSDPIRLAILDILKEKPMSVQDIVDELRRRGIDKSINAVRYHLKVLKEGGLIELVGVEEVRGGVLKYYAPSKEVYFYDEPKEITEIVEPFINILTPYVKKGLEELITRYREELIEAAKSLKPCPYCYTQHFIEHIILESFKGAVGRILKEEDILNELREMHREADEPSQM